MFSKFKLLSQQKSNLVFDFDKTIAQMEIDWSGWHLGIADIYTKFDTNHGYKRGKNPHESYNELAATHGKKLINAVQKFVSDYEKKYTTGFTPNPKLVAFIKANSSNRMYIYSSNSRYIVELGLQTLGITTSFDQIIFRDDVDKVKPDPEGFYLINNFNQQKESFLMIGDSSGDQIAAQQAGIDFFKCTYFETYEFSGDS